MIDSVRRNIPDNHPVRHLFHTLTERGLEQTQFRDPDTIQYITNLLTEFIEIDNMYCLRNDSGARLRYIFEMLERAGEAPSVELRRSYYKHLGDLVLFNLGLFPESLQYGRHTVSPGFYAEQGRRSYSIVAELEKENSPAVYRNLSEQFKQCVIGLNWVKIYINDPFYQYIFREFNVT